MSKIIMDQVSKADLLADGLRMNIDLVKFKGLSLESVESLKAATKELADLDNEKERIRETLVAQIRKTTKKVLEVRAKVKNAKRIVKANFPKEQWKSFGIYDKQ